MTGLRTFHVEGIVSRLVAVATLASPIVTNWNVNYTVARISDTSNINRQPVIINYIS